MTVEGGGRRLAEFITKLRADEDDGWGAVRCGAVYIRNCAMLGSVKRLRQ